MHTYIHTHTYMALCVMAKQRQLLLFFFGGGGGGCWFCSGPVKCEFKSVQQHTVAKSFVAHYIIQ